MRMNAKRPGFTLIELLVVVSIIALLVSILLPALSKAKDTARIVICRSNVKQQMTGALMYSMDYNNVLPLWWDGVSKLSPLHETGVATTNGTTEHLKYYGKPVNLGRLYPDFMDGDGHIFYCPSKAGFCYDSNPYTPDDDYGFKHIVPTDPGSVSAAYQYRGSLDPQSIPSIWGEPTNNPSNKPSLYRIVKILDRHPDWIVLADYGGMKYNDSPGIINHKDRQGRPKLFNNGYADGHVTVYRVRDPDNYPLASSPFHSGVILRMMEAGTW